MDANEPSEFIKRLKPLVERSGKTRQQIEKEARLGRGALSHMLSGRRGVPRAKTLARLAAVLGAEYEYLAVGSEIPPGALRAPVPGLSPTLDQLPGYADVELEVGRLEPKIPLSVFQSVRLIRLHDAPIPLTTDFIRGLAVLMATRVHVVDETQNIQQKTEEKRRRASGTKTRRIARAR